MEEELLGGWTTVATIEAYQLANGARRYQVRYRTPENKQTKKRGFSTKKAAESHAAQLQVSKLRDEFVSVSDSRITINELAVTWLARQTHLKPSAYRPVESAGGST
jgi:hypothetical protein